MQEEHYARSDGHGKGDEDSVEFIIVVCILKDPKFWSEVDDLADEVNQEGDEEGRGGVAAIPEKQEQWQS